jgi:DNA helicase-2/ATP-dependent DNA helicase PcrA
MHGEINLCRPSRFVREVPRALIEEVRLKSTISRPAVGSPKLGRKNPSGSLDGSVGVPQTSLSLGQRVIHGKFGEGVVLNYEGQGSNARVQVNFDGAGSKWLVLSYAKLEVLG